MPSALVIDLSPTPREETALEKTLGGFSKRHRQNQLDTEETDALKDIYKQYQQDGQNLEKTIQDIQTRPGLSPTTRVNTVNQLLQFQKHNAQLIKDAAKQNKNMTPEQKEDRKQRLIEEGFTDNEADEYLDATPGVQQIIWRQHNDLKSRNLRGNKPPAGQNKPNAPTKNGVVGTGEKPPEGELGVEDSFSNEAEPIDEDACPEIPTPPKMTPAEEVKWGNQNQKENNKLLNETRKKTDSIRGIGIRLNRLSSLSEKVPDGI